MANQKVTTAKRRNAHIVPPRRAIQNGGPTGNSTCRFVGGKLVEYGSGQDVPLSMVSKKKGSTLGEKLRSQDKETRLGAVAKLKEEGKKEALVFVATYCEHPDTKEAAIEALAGNWNELVQVARYNTSDGAGIAVVTRIIEDIFVDASPAKTLQAHERMVEIAKRAGRVNVALAPVAKLDLGDERLADIACNSNHPEVRMAAFEKISGGESIVLVMRDSIFSNSKNAAIEKALEMKLLNPEQLVNLQEVVDTAMKQRKKERTASNRIANKEFTLEQMKGVIDYLAAKKKATVEQISSDPEFFDNGLFRLG